MRSVRVESQVNCTPDVFWKLFVDRAYNEELFLKELAFREFEILELTSTTRRIRCVPKVSMPKALQKLVGDSFGYEERGKLDAQQIWRWEVIPTALASKVSNTGTVRLEPLGADRCTRIDEMTINAKVFGVGGMIESTTEQQVTDAWRKTATFTNAWLARSE